MIATILITYKLCKVNNSFKQSKKSTMTAIEQDNKHIQQENVPLTSNSKNKPVQSELSKNQKQLGKKRAKKANQIYKLLIIINVCFFVLVNPLVLSNSLGILGNENKMLLELVYILAYLNHCINFIFYGLSCKVYRTILHDTFFKKE